MSEYNMTPRKLFEYGVISAKQLWERTTPEERDAIVLNDIREGRTSVESPEYADYYNHRERYHGRWDPAQFSQGMLERFPWLAGDDTENI